MRSVRKWSIFGFKWRVYGYEWQNFFVVTIRHGQTCTRLVVSLLVHVCPLSLLLMMYESLLENGKAVPQVEEGDDYVKVTVIS